MMATPELLQQLLPQIVLLLLAFMVLGLDFINNKKKTLFPGWVAVIGLIAAGTATIYLMAVYSEPRLVWGEMIRLDQASGVFSLLFIAGAIITVLFAMDDENLNSNNEFYFLLIISTLGLTMLAASADLIMVFLSLETVSIPLYILAGFINREPRSVESGLKYMLYGAVASVIMLFGFTFIYGFTGTTHVFGMREMLQGGNIPSIVLAGVVMFVMAGVGFKISAVPFHFWAPDVYEGSPSVVTGFLSTVSKAGGFAILLRLISTVFPLSEPFTLYLLAAMAVASMLVGNLLALNQKNFKRFLAYSSIAQAGYILVGVVAFSSLGVTGVTYYLMAYLATNLVAFAIAYQLARTTGSDDISTLAGLSQRSPFLGFALLTSLLSLGGIPPFAGFVGKLLVFSAGVQSGLEWLVVIAVLNSVLSLYYYLRVIKVAYLDKPWDTTPLCVRNPVWLFSFGVCLAGILIMGVIILPWFAWVSAAALSLALH